MGDNPKVAIITYGFITKNSYEAAVLLSQSGIAVRVIKLLQIKPIDFTTLNSLLCGISLNFILEEGIYSGGVGEQLKAKLETKTVVRAVEDRFITFGDTQNLYRECGFLPEQIKAEIESYVR